jgi:hypothetical protein
VPRTCLVRILLGLALCAAPSAAADLETSLYLIGDAGAPDPRGEPVLSALRSELSRDPARSFAVFLGDNIYPRGLPAPGAPERAEAERRIDAQIDTARGAGARTLFIPGNHDWGRHGADGWNAIRRQARYIAEKGARLLPEGGLPGPAIQDLGERLRLVVVDTQWWLHNGPKPEASEKEVLAALHTAVADANGRRVIVLSHHPPVSGGKHGGHFSWKDHLFPLRAWKAWMWLPLPGMGSLYPLARKAGVFGQDTTASGYRRMIAGIESALAGAAPLLWAAGHEHGLQVLEGPTARYVLVSGAGIYGHTKEPTRLRSTLFESGGAGFMRVDVDTDGAARLVVLGLDRQGHAAVRFAKSLE